MENMFLGETFNFKKIIILDIANNHYGDVSHGIDIINNFSNLNYPEDYKVYFKLQYRNLDTFIHKDSPKDSHYIKRFNSTKLTKQQLLNIAKSIKDLDSEIFKLMITPFDEDSISWSADSDVDIIKIASCSANDWPLLEEASTLNKPIVASTGGLNIESIDNLVSFLRHRAVEFSLMHCISVYPTKPKDCNLSFINTLKKRYPKLSIGWSTHEPPTDNNLVIAAISRGADLLERHICLPTSDKPQNGYSSTPDQLQKWLDKINLTHQILGQSNFQERNEEINSIKLLSRGVYAKSNIKKGNEINREDIYFAFPIISDDQHTSSSIKFPSNAIKDIKKDESLIEKINIKSPDINPNQFLKSAIHEIKALLALGNIHLNSTFSLELSHHKGPQKFRKVGTTIINCINREYCKKILVQLPKQQHPLHYHPRKEETFQILFGTLEIISDGHKYILNEGETLTVLPGVWHCFYSEKGCIFEEVSTTHFNEDSVYKEKSIQKLKREERKTTVDHWGRFQM
ncbi:MAG: sialic acid synthase [Prochlorococcus sp. SP3034]|nr:sialic acid synthase [Prochlorococcus sp. SP3034]|tara:strand:- start:22100 stop:23641 length:1542 start_codon:yes stop_codon:yes gene_type:complete